MLHVLHGFYISCSHFLLLDYISKNLNTQNISPHLRWKILAKSGWDLSGYYIYHLVPPNSCDRTAYHLTYRQCYRLQGLVCWDFKISSRDILGEVVCTRLYESAVDILSQLVFILDKNRRRFSSEGWAPPYLITVPCFIPRGIYTNYCPKIVIRPLQYDSLFP